ncbi:CHAP domain-containing protein [Egicoccus sp. AB-alg6-2]|uniref:CHAP domain-containing protein n=1 Tax=Egicoccus sp. AB-alg6-2 TaxID=3242692 RepID=UPI00359E0DE9
MNGFTAASVLEVARAEIGVVEAPGRRTKYGKWYGLNGQLWCAMFTSWCFAQVGAPRNGMTFTAWTPGIYAAANTAGRWHTSPRSGDLVLFSFEKPSPKRPLGIAHVGLVEKVGEGGVVTTIEGNTNAAGSGSGGRVMRKNRRTKIAGFARPAYQVEAPRKLGDRLLKLRTPHLHGEDVLEWQRDFLVPWRKQAGGPQVIVPKGNFLELTVGETKAFQRALGVDDDGEVGSITLRAARAWRARQ